MKCCVKQSNCEDREHTNIPAKRLKRKSRSLSPTSSQTEPPFASNPWHQRCTICQKGNPYCCFTVETDAELSGIARKHSDVTRKDSTVTREHSDRSRKHSDATREHPDDARHIHLDGSNCGCTCCTCCWAIEDAAYDLLERCLDLNPHTRITAAQALGHAFFKDGF